jgi:hypothetical protein
MIWIASVLHHWRKCEKVMAVWQLTAFFDESGHPRDPKAKMFGMSCYFAPAIVWAKLERQWQHRLDEVGIKQFHASDCETGGGIFRQWPKKKRLRTYKHFARIVARHGLVHITCVMDMLAYRKLEHEFDPKLESPYILAFLACLGALVREADKGLPTDEKIACIIELQKEYKGIADAAYETILAVTNMGRRLLPVATFAPKEAFLEFQVADIIAYEFSKFHLNRVHDPTRPPRKSLVKMIGKTRIAPYYYGESHLKQLVARARRKAKELAEARKLQEP